MRKRDGQEYRLKLMYYAVLVTTFVKGHNILSNRLLIKFLTQ